MRQSTELLEVALPRSFHSKPLSGAVVSLLLSFLVQVLSTTAQLAAAGELLQPHGRRQLSDGAGAVGSMDAARLHWQRARQG